MPKRTLPSATMGEDSTSFRSPEKLQSPGGLAHVRGGDRRPGRVEEETARPAGVGRPVASGRGGRESEQQAEHEAAVDARRARAHGWREPRHSPPHSAGVKSGEGGNCLKFTANRDDRTTVTPSGKRRFFPSVTGGCGCLCLSNRTIDTLPHRVSKVTGSRFSSA